jgi:hypothetical protein
VRGRSLAAGSNPAGRVWVFVPCEFSVLSGSLCDDLITRPEEYHRMWFVDVFDLESSKKGQSPLWAAAPQGNKVLYKNVTIFKVF